MKHVQFYGIVYITVILAVLGTVGVAILGNETDVTASKTYTYTVSLVNNFTSHTDVKLLGDTYSLEPFEVASVHYRVDGPFEISIRNEARDFTRELFVPFQKIKAQTAILPLNTNPGYCIISANVTDLYLQTDVVIGRDIKVITQSPSSYGYFPHVENLLYVYPGDADLETVESRFNAQKLIRGYYPVECAYVENVDYLEHIPFFYRDYDYKEQQDLYENEVNRIENLSL